jgi:prepilin-type N-terminal cleavage/methylation domain-containing protein
MVLIDIDRCFKSLLACSSAACFRRARIGTNQHPFTIANLGLRGIYFACEMFFAVSCSILWSVERVAAGGFALKKHGFTLVELLVVIAIIGVLMGLLLPAVQMAREAARKAQCQNNLRQLGLALLNFESAKQRFPAGWVVRRSDLLDPDREHPGYAWSYQLLPNLELGRVHDRFDRNLPVNHVSHHQLIKMHLPTFVCPSDSGPNVAIPTGILGGGSSLYHDLPPPPLPEIAKSNYLGVFGTVEVKSTVIESDGMFFRNSKLRIAQVSDGTSNTFFVGERSSELGVSTWSGVMHEVPESIPRVLGACDHLPNSSSGHFEDFSSHHPQGANFVTVDGATRLVSDDISMEAYLAMATRSGSEVTFPE